jgi:GT2 family glycosyltransferase
MFSIVVLTHNKSEYTKRCFESILKTHGATFEVIVVDNGSNDATPSMLTEMKDRYEAAGARLRTQFNGRNVGCSTARNMGMAMAAGEYVVFLDNDTIVADDHWLSKLVRPIEEDPRVKITGPKMTYPFPPHRIQCAGVGISRSGRVAFLGRGLPREEPRFNVQKDVQCVISACMMFPKRLADEIGGLDEAFNPIQYEDLDFCYRARAKGYRVVYVPGVEVHHWESITSDGTPAIPNRYLIIKHGMIFKKRWRHMFEKEDGPSEDKTRWRSIEVPSLEGHRKF